MERKGGHDDTGPRTFSASRPPRAKLRKPSWTCNTQRNSIRPLGPTEYDVPGVTYLSPADQEALPYLITGALPWNHFGRKNVGYMYAVHHGAKVWLRQHLKSERMEK